MRYQIIIGWVSLMAIASTSTFVSGCASTGEKEANKKEIELLKKENSELKRQVRLMRRQLRASSRHQQPIYRSRTSDVRLGDKPVMGSKKATVALIEFSDYFCPYCSQFHRNTFELLKKNYIDTGKMQYVYRDYPRAGAKQAVDAAVAVNCAGDQGAYWKMHKKLFLRSPRINQNYYRSTANGLGLNTGKYESCLKNPQNYNAVKKDFDYGGMLGVRGTPTFYIGRVKGGKIVSPVRIVGAQPYKKFSESIDRILNPVK